RGRRGLRTGMAHFPLRTGWAPVQVSPAPGKPGFELTLKPCGRVVRSTVPKLTTTKGDARNMNSEFAQFGFLFVIPIVAIIGGIPMGIVRTVGQQRMAELARKERIAAIERGLDPDKLPPLGPGEGGDYDVYGVGNGRLRRAHGLMIAGLILVAVGIGL